MVRPFLGKGWKFPIRVNAGGGLSYAEEEQLVQELIWIIVGTAHGERQMLPRFGCGIHELVFSPNNPATYGTLSEQIRSALTTQEPRIDVIDVRIETTDEQNLLLIYLDYRIRSNNAFYNMVYPFYVTEGRGG